MTKITAIENRWPAMAFIRGSRRHEYRDVTRSAHTRMISVLRRRPGLDWPEPWGWRWTAKTDHAHDFRYCESTDDVRCMICHSLTTLNSCPY